MFLNLLLSLMRRVIVERRTRRELAELDSRLLADVGLSRMARDHYERFPADFIRR